MGVTGLWKLIEESGKPVPLETLENKVLAIDISIWLHQVVKGFQDNKGNALAHAHLLGLFHRLCKLLYYRIKPVFIFDGGVPHLKRETIAKRNKSRNKLLNEADRLQQLLLNSLAKEKIVQRALGAGAEEILKSPQKPNQASNKPDKDDLFKLPELPNQDVINTTASSSSFYSSESENSFEEKNLRYSYQTNLQCIDVTSADFKCLPADVRHDILTDIKETRKQSSWGKLHELPIESDKFSGYQMKRLLKRRQVQVSLEEAETQMGGKSLTLSELRTLLSEEGIVTASSADITKRIASDENTRFLLVRDLKRAIENAERNEEKCKRNNVEERIQTEESSSDGNLGDEYDEDMQRAIKLSLEANEVYNDDDYKCDEVKMNREQRKQLHSAALSLARTYMIEYGSMNDDEIKELFENTQTHSSGDLNQDSLRFNHNDSFILEGKSLTTVANETVSEESIHMKSKMDSKNPTFMESNRSITIESSNIPAIAEDTIAIISSDSDNDSDLVEVVEENHEKRTCLQNKLSIVIDLSEDVKKEEDIFADVFEKQTQPMNLSSEILSSNELRYSGNTISSDEDDKIIAVENKQISSEEDKGKEFDVLANYIKSKNTNQPKKPDNILSEISEDSMKVSKNTLHECLKPDNQATAPESKTVEYQNQKPDVAQILESLKREASEIPKIGLDDIQVDLKNGCEIIEIPDDEISLINKTPSKKDGVIHAYFETDFVVKRTPERKHNEEKETTPKVKSPFFVNKTPESSRSEKRHILLEDDEMHTKRSGKASKVLFQDGIESADSTKETHINPLEIAAQALKETKTTKELESLAKNITKEKQDLEYESNRQNRMGMSITDKMNFECMHLLRLFGIPYIVAPMEAESQCAFLDAMQLTDGTITDDSDIWLFGGRTVYKNFFNQKKHVLEFKVDNIEKLYSVDREKLIQLAILVGSDYTSGICGIGTVTALEILAAFPTTPAKEGETSQMMSILSSLRKFRDWWRNGKNIGVGGRTTLKNKLKNIELTEGFPNSTVVEAYLNPSVDTKEEKFTWGKPDVEAIREFTKKTFGWTRIKTDETLDPILRKMNEKKMQSSIKNFFKVKSALSSSREIKVSKRVKTAINRISKGVAVLDEEESSVPKTRKVRKPRAKKSNDLKPSDLEKGKQKRKKTTSQNSEEVADDKIPEASTSSEIEIENSPPKILKKSPHFPDPNPAIPQKENDRLQMQKRKEMAAELFKTSQNLKKLKMKKIKS